MLISRPVSFVLSMLRLIIESDQRHTRYNNCNMVSLSDGVDKFFISCHFQQFQFYKPCKIETVENDTK